jgi:hypothetical protein
MTYPEFGTPGDDPRISARDVGKRQNASRVEKTQVLGRLPGHLQGAEVR